MILGRCPVLTMEAINAAAKALCRHDGHPENIQFEGRPMWESYTKAAIAALVAAVPHLPKAKDEGAKGE